MSLAIDLYIRVDPCDFVLRSHYELLRVDIDSYGFDVGTLHLYI